MNVAKTARGFAWMVLGIFTAACAATDGEEESSASGITSGIAGALDNCPFMNTWRQEDSNAPPYNPEVWANPQQTSTTLTWNDNTRGTDTVGFLVETRGERGDDYPEDFCPHGVRASMDQRDMYGRITFTK